MNYPTFLQVLSILFKTLTSKQNGIIKALYDEHTVPLINLLIEWLLSTHVFNRALNTSTEAAYVIEAVHN